MSPTRRLAPDARRGSRRCAKVLLSGLSVIGVGVLAAGLAFAYFVTTDGSSPAASVATTLVAPSSVSASEASATSVNITWSNPSGQPPGTEYVVQRTSPSSVTVCTTTGSSQLGNTSISDLCQDSGLSPGTAYSYSVTATLGNWVSTAGTASVTTMAVNITSPTNGSTFGGNWGGSISGTSAPATGKTISTVNVSIQQASGSCWGGTGNTWTATCPNYVATNGTVSNWTLSLPIGDLNSGNTYHITARATDSSSISASATSSFTFTITGPSPAAPVPSATTHFSSLGIYWVNAETVNLTDTVTPGSGTVSSVAYYWCPTASCTSSNGTLIGTSSGGGPSWSVNWTSANLPSADGLSYVVAVATDSLSNKGTSTTTEIGVDRTSPTVSTPSVNGQS